MINMSKKRHLIIAGLASMTLFAGFTTYADYYDQVKNNNIAGFSTEAAFPQSSAELNSPAPQNTLLFSKVFPGKVAETLPLQEQPPAAAKDPAPGQPAPQAAQPETIPLPNLPPVQADPQPAVAPDTPSGNLPQVNQPVQDPIPPAPAPAKKKTTTTRAS